MPTPEPAAKSVPVANPVPQRAPVAARVIILGLFISVAALGFFEFRAQNKSLAAMNLVDSKIELMNEQQDYKAKPEAFRKLVGRLPAHIEQNDFELVETFTWEGIFRRFHLTISYRFATDPQFGTVYILYESNYLPQSRLTSD